MANTREGLRRITIVISILATIIASFIAGAIVVDTLVKDFWVVVLSGLGAFGLVWGIYVIIDYVVKGFAPEKQKKDEANLEHSRNENEEIQEGIIVEPITHPSLRIAVAVFAIQFILASSFWFLDTDLNMKRTQYWTGIILGWGSLFTAIKLRKLIATNVSRTASNVYAGSGLALLFVGGFAGGWILAIIHQVYGYAHRKGAGYYAKTFGLAILTMLCIYLIAGLIRGLTI